MSTVRRGATPLLLPPRIREPPPHPAAGPPSRPPPPRRPRRPRPEQPHRACRMGKAPPVDMSMGGAGMCDQPHKPGVRPSPIEPRRQRAPGCPADHAAGRIRGFPFPAPSRIWGSAPAPTGAPPRPPGSGAETRFGGLGAQPRRGLGAQPRWERGRSPVEGWGRGPDGGWGRSPRRGPGRSPTRARGRNPTRARGRNPTRARGRNPTRARGRSPTVIRGRNPTRGPRAEPRRGLGAGPHQGPGRSPTRARGGAPVSGRGGEGNDPQAARSAVAARAPGSRAACLRVEAAEPWAPPRARR